MWTTRTTLNVEALSFGEKIRIDLDDIDIESWRRDLWHDRETLRELFDEMRRVTPDRDLKLQALKRLIADKAANPINPGNRKVLIFSAFADTAEYLYRELAPALSAAGLETALITGGSARGARRRWAPGTTSSRSSRSSRRGRSSATSPCRRRPASSTC